MLLIILGLFLRVSRLVKCEQSCYSAASSADTQILPHQVQSRTSSPIHSRGKCGAGRG